MPSDIGKPETSPVIISQNLFESRFGGNRSMIGQTLRFDGTGLENKFYTLIGVMPRDFEFPPKTDFWLPVENWGLDYEIITRLAPESSIQQLQAEFDTILARMNSDSAQLRSIFYDNKLKVSSLRDYLVGDIGISMLVLLASVGMVMLIVCINVANLLLLRNQKRRHEMSVRAAIGATRFRLVRQTLAESGLLALFGGTLGILLAWWMIHLLPKFAPRGVLQEHGISLDTHVLLFSLVVTVFAGVLVSLLPALRQPWPALSYAIKRSGGHEMTGDHTLFHSILVSAQIALTLAVLCGAGLMIRSFIILRGGHPDMQNKNLIKFEITLGAQRFAGLLGSLESKKNEHDPIQESINHRIQLGYFYHLVTEQLRMLPEVKGAEVTTRLPGDSRSGNLGIIDFSKWPQGHRVMPGETAATTTVSPGYFEMMGVSVIAGRTFSETDDQNSPPVVIVNQTCARILYPGENPIGKNLFEVQGPGNPRIIGLVKDIRNRGFRDAPFPEVFIPLAHPFLAMNFLTHMSVVVETHGSSRPTASSLRAAVARIDPEAPISGLMTMDEYMESFIERDRFSMLLLSLFGAVTLILAAVGIFGVMTQSVEHRQREMAVRIALGATSWQVMKLILGRGAIQTVGGLTGGLLGAFFITRALRSLLVQVKPYDPVTLVSVLSLLLAVSFFACYLPARHATRVDALTILGAE